MKTIFKKIIDGEIPSFKIYEDDLFIAILDAFPKNLGHTLVMPKEGSENLLKETEEIQIKLNKLAIKMSKVIKTNLQASGIKIVVNNGESAGQEIFHTHVHIIPYYDKETKVIVNQSIVDKINY